MDFLKFMSKLKYHHNSRLGYFKYQFKKGEYLHHDLIPNRLNSILQINFLYPIMTLLDNLVNNFNLRN